MKPIHSLPIFRRDDCPLGHVYAMPLGSFSSGGNLPPGIYVSTRDERSDDEIRRSLANLDPSKASA